MTEAECAITNLSFHDLTDPTDNVPKNLKNLLGLNLNFCISPAPPTKGDLLKGLDGIIRSYRIKNQFGGGNSGSYNKKLYVANPSFSPEMASDTAEKLFDEIRENILTAQLPQRSSHQKNLNRKQHQLLNELVKRKDLIVVPTDKNLGPSLMSVNKYIQLCYEQLLTETYKEVHLEVSVVEDLLRDLAGEFVEKLAYNKDNKIIVHDLQSKTVNQFSVLTKIHKPVLAGRPIVSNSSGILSGLSKWLDFHLQPFVRQLKSYIKDSDQLLETLATVSRSPEHRIFTFDVVSMYTNICTSRALKVIADFLPKTQFYSLVVEGIRIIMENNFFVFEGKLWKQQNGTAMGTSVAPSYAVLFLGIIEQKLYEKFSKHMTVYKRYIDDGFTIWCNNGKKFSFNQFIAALKRDSGLDFTWEEHATQAVFLDLIVRWNSEKYWTCTNQKELNLYLYVPANSAHPPGVLKSVIYGRILKFWKQNTFKEDFQRLVQSLFDRLQARGYHAKVLEPVFIQAFSKIHDNTEANTKTEQLYLKLPYSDSGLSRSELEPIFQLKRLETLMEHEIQTEKLTLCFTRPKNLKDVLCPSKRLNHPSK